MDLYTLTYRLEGEGSDTVSNYSGWEDLAGFIAEEADIFLKVVIGKVGNPTPPTTLEYLVSNCSQMTEFSLINIDTSNVTSMKGMFDYCSSLVTLDLSGLDTSNVSNMESMFGSCQSLTSLDIGGFDTSNVVNMNFMFNWCTSLTSLDLSNFDTSGVEEMKEVFYQSSSLETILVSDLWSNSSVTESDEMFDGCTSLVGAAPYDSSKTDVSMANYTTGYFTKKEPPIGPFIGEKYPLPPFKV